MTNKIRKWGVRVIIAGVVLVVAGAIVNMATLFSVYGKVSSDSLCSGDECTIDTEFLALDIGRILMYVGLALVIVATTFLIVHSFRNKK